LRPDRARSVVLMFGTSLGVAGLSLWNVLITSRGLGVAGRGQVAFLLTVGTLTAYLATIGVQEANTNVASQSPQRTGALAANSVLLAVVFGGLAAALIAALVALEPALGGSGPRWLLWVVLAALPGLVLHVYLRQLVLAHYRFGVLNTGVLLTPALNALVNTTLAVLGILSVPAAVGIWLTGQGLAATLYAIVVARTLGGFARPDIALARSSLRFGAKAHVGRTLSWGSYRLDQWLVGVIGGDRMLGLYSVAVAWSEVLFLLPEVLQTVLRPDLVRAERDGARRQTAIVMRFGLLLTILAAAGVVLLAPFLCVTVLGEDFRGAVTPLRILTVGSIGVLALKVYGSALLARRRPMLDSAAVAPALVTMLALDALLVPAAGVVGAAVASTVAYLVGGAVAVLLGLHVLGGRMRDLVPTVSDVHIGITQLKRLPLRRGRQPDHRRVG
jgi:O-antigen/teichoic acid export membrane protein